MTEHTDTRPALTSELRLGNGVTLPNRIAKAATSEHLATRHGAPTRQLTEVYRQLASTGAGLLISGNVMVDGSALEAHRNVVIEDERFLPALRDWAAATAGTDTKFILQLSHPGRQTMRGLSVAGRRRTWCPPRPCRWRSAEPAGGCSPHRGRSPRRRSSP
jgi:2,4-dienoyl-CoA reductase-like NADH-dependent reductase (Old Yellow Enzyme family)